MTNSFTRSNGFVKKAPKGILFDLDGTLVDSAPDLTNALNKTLISLNFEPVDLAEVKIWIGNGVDKLLHRAITKSNNKLANDSDFWRARNIFYVEYEKQSGRQSTLYSGVIELFEALNNRKIEIACVTNKSRCFTLPLLRQLEIEKYFSLVVCGDDLTNKKPHPEPLLYAVTKMALVVEQCLMVGDSSSDISAANAANMEVICVDYGYSQGVDLSVLNISGMISKLSELSDCIGQEQHR